MQLHLIIFDDPPHKRCPKCGETKPAIAELYGRDRTQRDGLSGLCKDCHRAYREANKERKRKQVRAWYDANRQRVRARNRAWYEANRDRVRELSRARYKANKKRLREQGDAWRKANPEKARAIWRRRRALNRNAEGNHTAEDVQRQYKAQKGKCYYCGVKVGKKYHADHAIPLSRGGSNGPENIVVACPSCNQAKNNKLPHEWPQGGRLL
jgi:5-methylcytosine-specific restriction endonuclease McrA